MGGRSWGRFLSRGCGTCHLNKSGVRLKVPGSGPRDPDRTSPSAERHRSPHLLLSRLPRPRPPHPAPPRGRAPGHLPCSLHAHAPEPPQSIWTRDPDPGTTCPEGRRFSQVTLYSQEMALLETRKRHRHAERQGDDPHHFSKTTVPPSLGVN